MAATVTIKHCGYYRTKAGQVAQIVRIVTGKAHGMVPGVFERTWWYPGNGEHVICPSEDLIRYLGTTPPEGDDV